MQTVNHPNFDRLYGMIEAQKGYFTAVQAKQNGYSPQLQSHYVQSGRWLRKGRGIYRLKHFPAPFLKDDLYTTYLWTCNRQGQPEGAFSHGTALYLHNLGTYVPPVLDLSVPKTFRRYSKPPYAKVELFHRELAPSESEMLDGVRVTKPLRSIIDLLVHELIDRDYVLDALKMGLERFRILHSQLESVAKSEQSVLLKALTKVNYERVDEIRKRYRIPQSGRR